MAQAENPSPEYDLPVESEPPRRGLRKLEIPEGTRIRLTKIGLKADKTSIIPTGEEIEGRITGPALIKHLFPDKTEDVSHLPEKDRDFCFEVLGSDKDWRGISAIRSIQPVPDEPNRFRLETITSIYELEVLG